MAANETDWVVLVRRDLLRVVSAEVLSKSDANILDDAQPDDAFDIAQPTRSEACLNVSIGQFRDAVRASGRYPLSVTAGAVPNEAVPHVLHLAAFELINTTPNLPMVVIEGQPTFQKFYDDAMKYLDGVKKGGQVPEPTDPTGQDYATAVSADNPAVSLVRWSDANASKDDYARGYLVTATGSTISLPLDDMRTM